MDMYMPAEGTPAGDRDTSDGVGPSLTGVDGIVVPRAVMYGEGGFQSHRTATGDTVTAPPLRDRDGDGGLPDHPRYEGPSVADQAPIVNPSAGVTGPAEQGPTDINPTGPVPTLGSSTAPSARQAYPDTTKDSYPR